MNEEVSFFIGLALVLTPILVGFYLFVQDWMLTGLTAIQLRAEPDPILNGASQIRLTSADSVLRLDLEIALSGGPSLGPALRASSARPKMR